MMTEEDLRNIRAEYQPKVTHYNEVAGEEFGIRLWNNRSGFDVLLPDSVKPSIETWCEVTVPEYLRHLIVGEYDHLPITCYICHEPMTAIYQNADKTFHFVCGMHDQAYADVPESVYLHQIELNKKSLDDKIKTALDEALGDLGLPKSE